MDGAARVMEGGHCAKMPEEKNMSAVAINRDALRNTPLRAFFGV
jgi:hypothetical protein